MDKFLILLWLPWEGVDAKKSKHVVDAEIVEVAHRVRNASSPPGKALLLVRWPVVQGYAPILPPEAGKFVTLKKFLWWRTAAPAQIKQSLIGPNISTVTADAE